MNIYTLVFLSLFLAFVAPARALERVALAQPPSNCALKETATLTLSLNGVVPSIADVNKLIDQKPTEIEKIAKEHGATTFFVQNKNVNINPAGDASGNGYNYNVNYSFSVEPLSAAMATLEVASAAGIRVGMNMSSYRQCQ